MTARGGRRSLALLGTLVLVWGLLMRQFGSADVYAVMGPFAATVIAAVRLLRGQRLVDWLAPRARDIAVGVALGLVMTLATYPAFRLAKQLWPGLDMAVRGLYRDASTTSLPVAMFAVSLLVLAEELLWRGALLEALERRMPRVAALSVSVVSYALAQLGTGSWVVFLLALVCGLVWTVQRRLTQSLLSPTITHMIWTQTVILIEPVVGPGV